MEKILSAVKATLYERMASPVYGPFILSWLFWNWKILFVIFIEKIDKLGTSTKIDYISTNYLDDKEDILIWNPLITALIIIFAFPFINLGINQLYNWIKRLNTTWRLKIQKKEGIDPENAFKLRKELNDIHDEYNNQLQFKEEKINELNTNYKSQGSHINKLQKTNTELATNIENLNTENQQLSKIAQNYQSLQNRYELLKKESTLFCNSMITTNENHQIATAEEFTNILVNLFYKSELDEFRAKLIDNSAFKTKMNIFFTNPKATKDIKKIISQYEFIGPTGITPKAKLFQNRSKDILG